MTPPEGHHRRLATVPAEALPPHPWRFRVGTSNRWSLYLIVPGWDGKADIFAGHLETEDLAGRVAEWLNAAEMAAEAMKEATSGD